MTPGNRLEWARGFIDQATLDSNFAELLYEIIRDEKTKSQLGSKPELYCPAIYAYCQQAIEKGLKALLWYESGSIPRRHNPMGRVLRLRRVRERNRPAHLGLIQRNRESINRILNMAPGAASETARMDVLLKQANTEYPFAASDGEVRLPCQEIALSDVAAALKITRPLVTHIRKYLEVAGLGVVTQ